MIATVTNYCNRLNNISPSSIPQPTNIVYFCSLYNVSFKMWTTVTDTLTNFFSFALHQFERFQENLSELGHFVIK